MSSCFSNIISDVQIIAKGLVAVKQESPNFFVRGPH